MLVARSSIKIFWIIVVMGLVLAGCTQKAALQAPSITSIQTDNTPTITLKWSVVESATSYTIQRQVGASGTYLPLATQPSLSASLVSLTDSDVTFATKYFYRIRSVGSNGTSDWADLSVTTPASPKLPPGVPQNFGATLNNNQILLTWQAPLSTVGNYILQRKVDGGAYAALTQTTTSSYTDSGLTVGSTYQYHIKATNSFGQSDWVESNPVPVQANQTAPGVPSNVLAYAVSSGQIQIGWQAPSSGGAVSSYTLQRQLASGSFGSDQTLSQASFSDTTISSALTYSYRVRANNAAGSSDWVVSNAVPVPQACASGGGTASSKGCFGPVSNWPMVPTMTLLLPTGKVMSWYSSDDVGKYRERTDVHNTTPRTVAALNSQDGTLAAVWNPASGSFGDASFGQRDNGTASGGKGTDLFCSGYTVLSNGKVFVAGGNTGLTWGSIRLNVFDPLSNTWENGPGPNTPNMWRDRWYPSLTKLPDGRVFIAGGSAQPDPSFVEGSSSKETAKGDPSRSGSNICRTANGVCPPGLQGTSGGIAPVGADNLPAGTPSGTVFSTYFGINGNGSPINSGYNNSFEIYDPNSGSLSMLGTTAQEIPTFEHYYPQFFVAPSGLLYLAGASRQRAFLNQNQTSGSPGSYWSNIQLTAGQRTYGTSVMYLPGMILSVGGGYAFQDSAGVHYGETATNNTPIKISLSSNTARISNGGPNMNFRRTHAMATLLADGRVFISGGQQTGGEGSPNPNGNLPAGLPWEKTVNPETIWNLDLAVKTAEIWNPADGSFNLGAKAQEERMYHSIALLLPDATVLTAGGGGCGFCSDQSLSAGVYGALDAPTPAARGNDANAINRQNKTNKKTSEIFYPPYLFKSDGSLAVRPIISSTNIPTVGSYPTITYNSSFTLNWAHPEAGHSISKVTFIALGAPTHAFNQNQRYLELPFTNSGNTLSVSTPSTGQYGSSSGRNIAPPGFYMLFILDDKNVPSVAKIVNIQ